MHKKKVKIIKCTKNGVELKSPINNNGISGKSGKLFSINS